MMNFILVTRGKSEYLISPNHLPISPNRRDEADIAPGYALEWLHPQRADADKQDWGK